jgi:uracil-DNA glycosylase
MIEAVRAFGALDPGLIALPHPAWRSRLWMQKHPWFEAEILPALQAEIRRRLQAA